jgi:FtsP/CotA-like multicopper oxidase with cupredoxin domain
MRLFSVFTLLAVVEPGAAAAVAAVSERAPGDVALLRPPEIRSVGGELATRLELRYGAHRIAGDPAWLRGYNGGLAGPVLRLRPGDTLRVDMINRLPKTPCNRPRAGRHGHPGGGEDPECPKPLNDPHGFNTTNLHTHGLWVSPVGNGDNVLLSLYPGDEFQNEIKIPPDHPPGTHWYHAHHHGSVALQVSSGLAGMLIVEGGLDDVPEIAQAREEILVFQQVSYSARDCLGEDGKDVRPPSQREIGAGCIESYANFGPGIWPHVSAAPAGDGRAAAADQSQLRQTSVNGQVQPTLFARPGEVVRLRTVHAGVRETINLSVWPHESRDQTRELMRRLDERVLRATGRPPRPRDYLEEEGKGKIVPLYELAADGIAFGRVDEVWSVELQPGYRSDLLARFDRAGDYVILDAAAGSGAQLRPDDGPERTRILAYVRVAGEPVVMELPTHADVAGLAPYPHIEDDEITGCQDNVFNIQDVADPGRTAFTVNDKPYDPAVRPRTVPLGKAEEWRLVSKFVNHPFHIHVNPFEVVANPHDPRGRNVWRDTLLVMGPDDARYAKTHQELYNKVIRVRTRYRRYIGSYVLHCHILDHEDQGMMEQVEVVLHPPTGSSVSCEQPIDLGDFPGCAGSGCP